MSIFFGSERLFPMKKTAHHLIAEVPRRQSRAEMTIGIDLGDVWSHYCTLNEAGEAVVRGRFRTSPKGLEKWFTDVLSARVAMEAGTHSIWISEQLQELGHEVIVANVRELRAISHSDSKSDHADAEKLARYAWLELMPPNFYYDQEDFLRYRRHVLRPLRRTSPGEHHSSTDINDPCGLFFAEHVCRIDVQGACHRTGDRK
jgi:hypothetical protein